MKELQNGELIDINGGGWLSVAGGALAIAGAIMVGGGPVAVGVGVYCGVATIVSGL